jgi:hypothetical protein
VYLSQTFHNKKELIIDEMFLATNNFIMNNSKEFENLDFSRQTLWRLLTELKLMGLIKTRIIQTGKNAKMRHIKVSKKLIDAFILKSVDKQGKNQKGLKRNVTLINKDNKKDLTTIKSKDFKNNFFQKKPEKFKNQASKKPETEIFMYYRKFLEKLYGIFGTEKYKLLLKNNNKNYYHEFNLAKQFLKKCGSEEIALLKIRAVYYKIISDDQDRNPNDFLSKIFNCKEKFRLDLLLHFADNIKISDAYKDKSIARYYTAKELHNLGITFSQYIFDEISAKTVNADTVTNCSHFSWSLEEKNQKTIPDDQFEQKSQEMEKSDISENKNFVQYEEPKMKEVIDYKTSYAIVQQAIDRANQKYQLNSQKTAKNPIPFSTFSTTKKKEQELRKELADKNASNPAFPNHFSQVGKMVTTQLNNQNLQRKN